MCDCVCVCVSACACACACVCVCVCVSFAFVFVCVCECECVCRSIRVCVLVSTYCVSRLQMQVCVFACNSCEPGLEAVQQYCVLSVPGKLYIKTT